MGKRLIEGRMQPGLFNSDMRNWLRFLSDQAGKLRAPCIDTSHLSKEELLKVFEETIKL
jgi:hypothetical protein